MGRIWAKTNFDVLHAAISCAHYSNVAAVALSEAGGNPVHGQQLLTNATHCVQPAYAYFHSKFDITTGEQRDTLQAFKAAQYCDPTQLDEIKATPTDIDSLTAFDFINPRHACAVRVTVLGLSF